MNITYQGSTGTQQIPIDYPSDFYPIVAKMIAQQENGKKVMVTAAIDDTQYAVFNVSVRSGTQNIVLVKSTLSDDYSPTDMKERYLACIDREKNAYKFYHMIPGNGSFEAKYGRCAVGAGQLFGERSCRWDDTMYYPKLEEKLEKGYVDISEYMLGEDNTTFKKAKKEAKKSANKELFDMLHRSARNVARENVNVPINSRLIKKSKELIEDLRSKAKEEDLDGFNRTLCLLMLIMQRRVRTGDGRGVEENMAHKSSDYGKIIQRETELCEIMEGALVGTDVKTGDFSDYHIEVYAATDEQKKFVMRHLEPSLKARVKKIYRVIPAEQKKKFEQYVKDHKIKNIKNLWHGSRNENWASIIKNGLLLNPNAVITGKMFGNGIYFAPSSNKSFNYTSYRGTTWARGRSDHGFMGLYATAYGEPYDIDHYSPVNYKKETKSRGCDCLHAHKGRDLHADEIVYYDERAMLLSYIVLFE